MAIAELGVNIYANTGSFIKSMNKVTGSINRTGQNLSTAGKSIMGLTAPLVGFGAVAVKSSADFNKSMAAVEVMIARTANTGGKSLAELKKSVFDLSNQTGISAKEITNGLFTVISTFGNTAEATEQLEVASKAALAGGSTITEAVGLLGVVAKNYGDISAEAQQRIVDLAFVTNELGVTTFQELAQSMGKVAPMAGSMGVSIDELFASYSALTGVTGNTAEVSTQFRASLVALQTPTGDMAKILKDLNYETGEQLLQEKGLIEAYQMVTKVAEEKGMSLGKVVGSVEAVNFVTALTTTQAEKFGIAMLANAEASGVGAKAYESYTEGVNRAGFKMSQLKTITENMMTQFGDELAPALLDFTQSAVVPLLNGLQGLLSYFNGLPEGAKSLIVQITAGTAAFGAITFVLGKVLSAFAGLWKLKVILIPLFKGLAVVIGALLSPIGLVVASVGGLSLVVYKYWEEIKSAIKWTKDFAVELGVKLAEAGRSAHATMKKMVDEILSTVTGGFNRLTNYIKDVTGRVTSFFNDMYVKVVGNSIVPDMVDGVLIEFDKMNYGILDSTESATYGVTRQFDQMSFGINNALSNALGDSADFVDGVAKLFNKDGVGGIVSDFMDSLKSDGSQQSGSFLDGLFSDSRPSGVSGPLMEDGSFGGGGDDDWLSGILNSSSGEGGGMGQGQGYDFSRMIERWLKVGNSTEETTEAIYSTGGAAAGAFITGGNPAGAKAGEELGAAYGRAIGKGIKKVFKSTTNPATLARREFESQFNEMIDGKNIKIFDENGVLREVDKISVGAKDRFNKPWAENFHELTGDASSSFLGIGYALQNLMGITEDVGGQIAHILATEIGGSMENLALILMGLEIPIEDMEESLVTAFMEGSISAHDFSVYMQGIGTAYQELENAQNDLGLAIQLWLGSGGEGRAAVTGFQAVINAATSQGIKSLEGMVQHAIASGTLTAQQGDQLLRAFAAHGITSMDQLQNASESTFIHIIGSLQSMEKEGENSFFGMSEKVVKNFENIEDRWNKIRNLPPANLDVVIRARGDTDLAKVVENNQTKSRVTFPALDSGGVITSPTLALVGERRNEAVIPLEELPDMMKSIMGESDAPSSSGLMKNVFNIDARGAVRGVGEEIKRALIDFVDVKNGLLGTT